jgi:hypothetical protein
MASFLGMLLSAASAAGRARTAVARSGTGEVLAVVVAVDRP